jgi:hypothetical protein
MEVHNLEARPAGPSTRAEVSLLAGAFHTAAWKSVLTSSLSARHNGGGIADGAEAGVIHHDGSGR